MPQELTFPLYIDSSMLTAWRACKRKHFWSTLHSLYPRGQSVHLIAGGAFAAGIEAARKRVFLDPAPRDVTHTQMLHAAYPKFLYAWGDFRPPENSSKTFFTTWRALEHYLEQHPPASDDLQPWIRPDGSPAVEYKFAVPLDDILHPDTDDPIFFAGRFDMIGVYSAAGQQLIGPSDEKTTGSLGFDWASKWDLRGQFMGYCWALRAQGIKTNHAIVRGVAILKTKNEVRTALIAYPDFILLRWERQMKRDIKEMITSYRKVKEQGVDHVDTTSLDAFYLEHLYPYNFGDSCDSYGGCAFTPLCSARNAEPFFTNYVKHRFNPLEVNPVEELQE